MTDHRGSASVIAVCSVCTGVGSVLGFIPGFIATALREDLGISQGRIGLLVGLYFGCTGVGSILGGRLTDRFGSRAVVVADMTIVALAAAFGAALGSYWALLVAACVAGAGYTLVNAGTNVAIAHAVPLRRRTLAMSIRTAGVPATAAIAAAAGPAAAQRWGWELLLWAVAGSALLAGAGAALLLSDSSGQQESERALPTTSLPDGFVWFPIGAFLMIAGSQPLYSWIVPYLEQSLDASPGLAGGTSAVASVVGVGVMIMNALRSDLIGPSQRMSRLVILLGVNATAIVLVVSGQTAGIGVSLAGTLLGISVQLSAIGIMHATIVDRVPGAVARATGWTMTGYYLGALVSPVAFGYVADVTNTFVWSWLATIVLLLLAIPAWLAAGRVAIVSEHC
ncbi:MAG: putative MFS family arabinose efflux permease [Paracrocinitomix sp.]|jgi:predicted MFS family arabinose efflux permease